MGNLPPGTTAPGPPGEGWGLPLPPVSGSGFFGTEVVPFCDAWVFAGWLPAGIGGPPDPAELGMLRPDDIGCRGPEAGFGRGFPLGIEQWHPLSFVIVIVVVTVLVTVWGVVGIWAWAVTVIVEAGRVTVEAGNVTVCTGGQALPVELGRDPRLGCMLGFVALARPTPRDPPEPPFQGKLLFR